MSDVSNQDLAELIGSMKELTSALKTGGGGDRAKPQDDKAEREYWDQKKKHSSALKKWGYEIDQSIKNQNKFGKELKKLNDEATLTTKALVVAGVAIGGVVTGLGGLVSILKRELPKSIDNYRALNDIGQTFGGSMLQMNIAATEARVGLEDFTKLMKANNLVVGSIGVKAFTSLSNGLKDSLGQFGMLGLSTEQLNEYLGEYMETQRAYGLLERYNQNQAVDSMKSLAIETTKMSALTGKSRADILKSTAAAMKEDSLRAYMSTLNNEQLAQFGPAMQTAINYMAGMPKEAGDTLSKALAQTLGRGSAWLADDVKQLASVGLGGVGSLMDSLADKVKSGTLSDKDLDAFRSSFGNLTKSQMETLRAQELSGNETAKLAIRMATDMQNFSKKSKEALTPLEKLSKMLLNVETTWAKLVSGLKERFFKGLGGFADKMEDFVNGPTFKLIQEKLGAFAETAGAWVAGALSPENFAKIWKILEVGGTIIKGVWNGLSMIGDGLAWMSDKVGNATTAIIALGAVLAGGTFIKAMTAKLNQKFVTGDPFAKYASGGAIRVVTMGGNGGGGGSDIETHEERRNRRKGQVERGRGRTAYGRGKAVRGAIGKGVSGIKRGIGGVRSLGGKLGVGGIGGLAMIGGQMALNSTGDFKGKGLAQSALNIGSATSTGAMIGSIIPGIGTAAGAIVGGLVGSTMELVSHWDDVSKFGVDTMKSIAGTASSIGSWMSDVGGKAWEGLKVAGSTVLDAYKSMWDGYKGIMSDLWGSISTKASEWASAATNFVKDNVTMENISKVASYSPVGMASKGAGMIKDVMANSMPSVNTDTLISGAMNASGAAQMGQMLGKMVDLLSENASIQKSGLIELIEETKKNTAKVAKIGGGL